MNQFIKTAAYLKCLFDQDHLVAQSSVIIEAIWAACSPLISDIAQHMPGAKQRTTS